MPPGPTDTGTLKSGTQLLEVVNLLQEHDGLGVSELADRLDKSRGAVHRYLKTLDTQGYVVQREGTYRLSLQFLDHGTYAQQEYTLFHASRGNVESLARRLDERAWCLVEENNRGVFLSEAVGENAVPTDARVGYHAPLHTTSGGKAILAHLDDARIAEVIDQVGLPSRTSNTITEEAELREELQRVRERGYALNLEESIDGLHAVGAPVFDDTGDVRGALSVAGAANRFPEDRCRNEIAEAVLTATNEVELQLNYS